MENLVNIWNELSSDFDKKQLSAGAEVKMNKNRSGLLLARLSRKLELGLYWSIFFLVGLIVVAYTHVAHIQVLALITLIKQVCCYYPPDFSINRC